MRGTRMIGVVMAVVALSGACSENDEVASTGTTEPTTTTSAPEEESTTTTVHEPEFPAERETLEHGGATWAVVLAGAPTIDAPEITAAVRAATAAGYTASPGDCDAGAPEALGLSEAGGPIYTVSVYFDSEADANEALDAFHASGFTGGVVAEVVTYCLD